MESWLRDTILGGIAYEALRWIVGSLIVSLLATGVLRVAFQKLKERHELFVFWGGSFLVCLVLLYFMGTRPQEPNLVGAIQAVYTGVAPGAPSAEPSTVAIFSIGIANTGAMQSIVKGWNVEAAANGVKYQATFVPMPKNFTFKDIPHINDDQPDSMTFKDEDNLLEKGLFPVQPGSFLQGIIFVIFRNVDPVIFKGVVDYSVNYEDVLSKKYSMPLKSTGQIGQVALMPGLHTEMVCRTPSWSPPAPLTTGSLPPVPPLTEAPPLNFTPLEKTH